MAYTGNASSGNVLTSNGSTQLPSFQLFPLFFIYGDSGSVAGDTITLTGGTSGAVFTGSGSTLTESFNFLALPTTSSSAGQIKINGNRFLHAEGTNNTFFGTNAGNFTFASTTSVGLGYQSLMNAAPSSANGNVAIGTSSLSAITGGSTNSNVAIGYQAGYQATTTFQNNVLLGANTCSNAGTGISSNVVIGINSMTGSSKTSPSSNVIVGDNAGTAITTGTKNTFIGSGSGIGVTTTAANININGGNAGNVGNQLTIGSGTGTGTQQLNFSVIYGIRGTTTTNADAVAVLIDSAGQLGTVSSSIRYKENVSDMEDVSSPILNIRPVMFDFKDKPKHKKCMGLIAEEVEQVMPSLVAYNSEGAVESVKYQDISILLLNEIKKALLRIEFLENKLKAQ